MPKPNPAKSAAVENVEIPAKIPESGRLVPQPHGGALKVGGTNPGAGRPSDAWKAKCAELADKGAKAAEAKLILENPEHPAWLGAWKFVAEQAHGRAAQPIVGDPDRPFEITVKRERKRQVSEAPEE